MPTIAVSKVQSRMEGRHRRQTLPLNGDVRAALAAHLRAQHEHRPDFWCYHGPRVELLERGEPLVVPWWQAARFMPVRPPQRGGSRHVRIEPDGTVHYVEPAGPGGWQSRDE